jgi:hypothetical protein
MKQEKYRYSAITQVSEQNESPYLKTEDVKLCCLIRTIAQPKGAVEEKYEAMVKPNRRREILLQHHFVHHESHMKSAEILHEAQQ